jgi:gliding motility-associated-like protein
MGDGAIITTNPVNAYVYADTMTYAISLYTVNSFGCNSDTLTKLFTVYPNPHVNAGPDRYILEGGSIVLSTVLYGNDMTYLWTTVLPTVNGTTYMVDNTVANPRILRPLTDVTYKLTVTARGGCTMSDLVYVKLLRFPVIPNTFTPNNDGINDTWKIDYLNTYPDNRVQVFTRGGQKVFESRGYNTPWDGTLKGKPLPVDTYYYIIEPGSGRDPITGYVQILK